MFTVGRWSIKAEASEASRSGTTSRELVYYENFKYANNAITSEKQVKAWTWAKRIALIKSVNPTWQDLAEGWGEKTETADPSLCSG